MTIWMLQLFTLSNTMGPEFVSATWFNIEMEGDKMSTCIVYGWIPIKVSIVPLLLGQILAHGIMKEKSRVMLLPHFLHKATLLLQWGDHAKVLETWLTSESSAMALISPFSVWTHLSLGKTTIPHSKNFQAVLSLPLKSGKLWSCCIAYQHNMV